MAFEITVSAALTATYKGMSAGVGARVTYTNNQAGANYLLDSRSVGTTTTLLTYGGLTGSKLIALRHVGLEADAEIALRAGASSNPIFCRMRQGNVVMLGGDASIYVERVGGTTDVDMQMFALELGAASVSNRAMFIPGSVGEGYAEARLTFQGTLDSDPLSLSWVSSQSCNGVNSAAEVIADGNLALSVLAPYAGPNSIRGYHLIAPLPDSPEVLIALLGSTQFHENLTLPLLIRVEGNGTQHLVGPETDFAYFATLAAFRPST